MKKYLRLIGVLMKLSLMSQLEYRVNFIAGVAVEWVGCWLSFCMLQ